MFKAKWLVDLRPLIADPTLTNPDFDLKDFSRAGMDFATQSDGTLDSMPYDLSYWILYCNKDLFAAKGVPLPTTIDEIIGAAAALNDPAKGIAGFTSRGLKNANVPVWTTLLLGQDTSSYVNGKLNTTGDAAVWAATVYQTLNKNYAPQGTVGFNWYECQATFAQGRAAMWLDGCDFATPLEDPKKSRVVGKVAYLAMPRRAEGAGGRPPSPTASASWRRPRTTRRAGITSSGPPTTRRTSCAWPRAAPEPRRATAPSSTRT